MTTIKKLQILHTALSTSGFEKEAKDIKLLAKSSDKRTFSDNDKTYDVEKLWAITKDNKVDDQEGFGTPNYKGGSPLALETSKSVYAKNKTLLESLNKDIIFGKKSAGESLLDENNLTE